MTFSDVAYPTRSLQASEVTIALTGWLWSIQTQTAENGAGAKSTPAPPKIINSPSESNPALEVDRTLGFVVRRLRALSNQIQLEFGTIQETGTNPIGPVFAF